MGTLNRELAWGMHRFVADRLHYFHPYSKSGCLKKVLFITEGDSISRSQIHPFFFYYHEIAERYGVEMREVGIKRFMDFPGVAPKNVDVVCLQAWLDLNIEAVVKVIEQIKTQFSSAKIVFIDAFAPLDLRWAERLDPYIDLYVKKHVFRDRLRYGQATRGHTNLTEYFGDRYELTYEETKFGIPDGFLKKVLLGPSFVTAPYILSRLSRRKSLHFQRKHIDLHARISQAGTDWYQAMRSESVRIVENLGDLKIACSGRVSKKEFLKELSQSRICFSPFGYGEVSWRDYEAVMCGSALFKPAMDHVETSPDIYIPHETYIPLEWDLSDLGDKVRFYLANPSRLNKIAISAYSVLSKYVNKKLFVDQMRPLFMD